MASQGVMEADVGNTSQPAQTSAVDSGSDTERADPIQKSNQELGKVQSKGVSDPDATLSCWQQSPCLWGMWHRY